MELCSEDHEEICFSGKVCPLCKVSNYADTLQEEIDQLTEDLEGAQNEIEELKDLARKP